MNIDYKKLIEAAKNTSYNSYSSYSRYAVGSAVLTENNKIYLGANIENASYGLTNCAERSALFNAVSNGYTRIKAIALWTPKPDTLPCGACFQVLVELAFNASYYKV
ncbi:MAG: cytidine deaminase [Endomicrobium sp.]|jgi:cytidine deaminase|nr:cytidine deaminase [Endomicrobium sp.]